MKRTLIALGVTAFLQPVLAAAATARTQALPPDCNRECLYGVLDQYLQALERRDPSTVPWADSVLFTENNVALQVGDGLWGTITRLGDYRLKLADTAAGQVAFFGFVEETREPSAFALRMKVENRRVSEVETVIFRLADTGPMGPGPHPFSNPVFEDKPILLQDVPPAQRRPRARMISIADGYFDTLQLNDGTLFTQFHEDCNRFENGVRTTNNPEMDFIPVMALGCEEQFRMGNYRYDDRLRARRFPLVDEERGLVLAAGFIDHSGRLGTYKLTDGTVVESPIRRPHSFYLMELFKIVDGRIRQVEAVFITVPYHMPSPWDERG